MMNLSELVKNVMKNPKEKNAWAELISYSNQQVEMLFREEIRETIKEYFKDRLPTTVEIIMDTEWESPTHSYEYLSTVLVDGESDLQLKELLNNTFDIETLRNNSVLEFSKVAAT